MLHIYTNSILFCFIPIQLARSNEYTVALRSVQSISGGVYRCEVSGDAPLFHTATDVAKMLVAQLPGYNPTVKIYDTSDNEYKKSVTIGDRIRAHCISGPSHPTVNFTWSINGVRLPVNILFSNYFFFSFQCHSVQIKVKSVKMSVLKCVEYFSFCFVFFAGNRRWPTTNDTTRTLSITIAVSTNSNIILYGEQ